MYYSNTKIYIYIYNNEYIYTILYTFYINNWIIGVYK